MAQWDYKIGGTYKGRIVYADDRNETYTVELEPGVTGTAAMTGHRGLSAGDEARFTVAAVTIHGTALEFAAAPIASDSGKTANGPKDTAFASLAADMAATALPTQPVDATANGGTGHADTAVPLTAAWTTMPHGHAQAVAAMATLRRHARQSLDALIRARQEWADAKTASQRLYESDTANIRKGWQNEQDKISHDCELEKQSFESQRDSSIQYVEQRRQTLTRVSDACQQFVNGIPQGFKVSRSTASVAMDTFQDRLSDTENAVTQLKTAYRALCFARQRQSEEARDRKLQENTRKRDNKLSTARTKQISRDEESDRRYAQTHKDDCQAARRETLTCFNRQDVAAYADAIRRYRPSADGYECPTDVPDCVMLGRIGFRMSDSTSDEHDVIQSIEEQTTDVGTKTGSSYEVEIPYAQRLSNGISLLMRYSPADRDRAQAMMQPLLLKLFMSFPAGKLEATMIDPVRMGASFPDIPKLAGGPDSKRVIDQQVWSQEKDITMAIATLRQRLENMTQSYGEDKESMLRKEVVRVLAIVDFPTGFTEPALKDLQAIVRNAAALNLCILICANDDELNNLRSRHSVLVNEISQALVETTMEDGRLMLAGDTADESMGRLFIEPDDMQDALDRKDDIIPKIRSGIGNGLRVIEPFDDMYRYDVSDPNNWGIGPQDGITIPIGIKGADTVINLSLGKGGGSTEHHALVAGQTGAGKSTFLHTLIMSTLVSYKPEDVQMYLLDFKEGVEFSSYTKYRLPSLRVVAINSEREFGLNVLKELCKELDTRAKAFTHNGVEDIEGYRRLTGVPNLPRLILIFDEVQELFRSDQGDSDSITNECLSCISKLVTQGRAAGIHLILACQDFNHCAGLQKYFSQIAIRIAIKGSADGASSILEGKDDIMALQGRPAGSALYNNGGGVEYANNPFQISYISDAERERLLSAMDAFYRNDFNADRYKDCRTRVLLTDASQDIHNCFNQLIAAEDVGDLEPLSTTRGGYGLLLGGGFGKRAHFVRDLGQRKADNLLIVTREMKTALSLCEFSMMSALYDELLAGADTADTLAYVVDLLTEDEEDDIDSSETDMGFLQTSFPRQIQVALLPELPDVVDEIYEKITSRQEGEPGDRFLLVFLGIDRARMLASGSMYDDTGDGEATLAEKMRTILTAGPTLGVNTIAWAESMRDLEDVLGDRYATLFTKHIAYRLDEDSMHALVRESDAKALQGKTAVWLDTVADVKNTHFRPYDIPTRDWVEQYADKYDQMVGEGE